MFSLKPWATLVCVFSLATLGISLAGTALEEAFDKFDMASRANSLGRPLSTCLLALQLPSLVSNYGIISSVTCHLCEWMGIKMNKV